MKYKTEEERKEANREAQRRFARTEKGKKYNLEKAKKWLEKKRETDPEYFKKFQKNRKEYFREYQIKLRKENPEKAREAGRKGAKRFYQKTKRHPKYIILRTLRRRLSDTIRKVGANKKASTMEILGCSAEDFKNYLENKFREGMIWENYGTWHIDHFYPCDSFDLTKDEEQKRCFHYTNLQPLWAKENIKKSNKIIEREVYV